MNTDLPMPSPVRQIDGLQILRFVAVLLVIWLHGSEEISMDGGRSMPNLGVFGIDIFFVISGFIISTVAARSSRPAGPGAAWSFLLRRLIRIFPLYWIVFAADAVRRFHSHPSGLRPYAANFFLLPFPAYPHDVLMTGISWTLVFELFFYAVLSMILLVTVRRSVYSIIVILASFILVGCFIDIRRAGLIVFCNPLLLEFLFGCVLALLYNRFGCNRRVGIGMVIAGCVAAISFQVFGPFSATGLQMVLLNALVFTRVFTWGLAAVLIVGGVIFWSPTTGGGWARSAVLLGNASYSTYLIAALDQEFAFRLMGMVTHTRAYPSFAASLAAHLVLVGLSLGTGLLVYYAVERPVLRYLNGFYRSWTAARAGPAAS
jgi:exopolysaccharide production protein ExoZ